MSPLSQFFRAALIIAAVIIGIIGLWAGRFLPDPAGHLFSQIFHIITTPILLEISFSILGVIIVLIIAHRAEKNADEWVEMDFPEEDTENKN